MAKKVEDLKYAVPFNQQEFPMNPELYNFQVYRTDNVAEYVCMMRAFFTYRKACAKAEMDFYGALLNCLH
jgi:hypothetical protein